MTRRPFSRFLRWFSVLMAGYFLIAAIFSTTVDPWRINRAPWAIDALDKAREISNARRLGKAALANRGIWQAAILGSSRIEIGLDPGHPVFHGKATVNIAMTGASLYENVAIGNYTLARNPQLKLLIFGIEPGDLHSDTDSRTSNLYYQSPFADNNHSIERSINQVIGWRALVESIETLRRHCNGIPPKFSPLGQMLQPGDHDNLRQFVEAMPYEYSPVQWNVHPQILRQQKADLLSGFVMRVRQAGSEMHIVISPQHALKQIHPNEDAPAAMGWESDFRALANICTVANARPAKGPPVKLWSFLTFNPFTTTPMPEPTAPSQQMPGWFDLGHFNTRLGNRMLETLFAAEHAPSTAAAPVGVNLLDGDWNALRDAWIKDHRDYCARHPQDVRWWRKLISRSAANPNAKD